MTALFERFGTDLPPLDGIYLAALGRRGGAAQRDDRRRREHHVPPQAGRGIGAAQTLAEDTRAPIRVVLVDHRYPRLALARPLHRGRRFSRHVRLRASRPGARGNSRRLGIVEILGRRATSDHRRRTAAHAQRGGHPNVAGGDQPGRRSPVRGGRRGLEPPCRGVSHAGIAARGGSSAARRRRRPDSTSTMCPSPATARCSASSRSATTAPAHLWQARLVPEAKPYPGGHRIHGVEVVPVSVLLQTLSAAAAECGASMLGDVRFEYPIVVDQPRVIQVVADDESVTVSSSPAADTPAHRWVRHVSARISAPAAGRRARRHGQQRRSRNARLRRFVGRRVAAGVGHRGAAVRMVDRLLPVGAGWIARRCRPAGGVDGRPARRRRSRRPPGGQLQPAADVSGRRRKCPVCSRTRRCAGFRRGTSARRQRR